MPEPQAFHVKRPPPLMIRLRMGREMREGRCPGCDRLFPRRQQARYELHWHVVHGPKS